MSTVVSINVSQPRPLSYKGRCVLSSIRKQPLSDAVSLSLEGLVGDKQADLRNHGGMAKAVYLYPSEHYKTWCNRLGRALPYGTLGENLTTKGLLESELCVGDLLGIADTLIEITQPRIPCYKLDMSIAQDGFSKKLIQSCKLGSYAKVIKGGTLTAGADIVFVRRASERVSVYEIARLYFLDKYNDSALRDVVNLKALPYSLRRVFERRLLRSDALKPPQLELAQK